MIGRIGLFLDRVQQIRSMEIVEGSMSPQCKNEKSNGYL